MEKYMKINEVSKILGISVPTIHYWQSEGLFNVSRNTDNDYRQFGISDILDIWEIMLYRDLEIPVKEIRSLLNKNIEGIADKYQQQSVKIEAQIELLKKKQQRISYQQKLITQIRDLQGLAPFSSTPDCDICYEDGFTRATMSASIQDPYICSVIIDESGRLFRGISQLHIDNSPIIWTIQSNCTYMEFLLKLDYNNPDNSNLNSVLTQIKASGLTPHEVMARYLIIAAEGNTRYEYYRAWIRVS